MKRRPFSCTPFIAGAQEIIRRRPTGREKLGHSVPIRNLLEHPQLVT
jgi:hypothetical protein